MWDSKHGVLGLQVVYRLSALLPFELFLSVLKVTLRVLSYLLQAEPGLSRLPKYKDLLQRFNTKEVGMVKCSWHTACGDYLWKGWRKGQGCPWAWLVPATWPDFAGALEIWGRGGPCWLLQP